MHVNAESKALIKLKPPIDTKRGETKIPFEILNGNDNIGGYGNVSVTIPQYYGVSIAA